MRRVLSWALPSTSFMFVVNEAALKGSSFPGSQSPPVNSLATLLSNGIILFFITMGTLIPKLS